MEGSKIVHLDTHVLVLLYERRFERFEKAGRRAIDKASLAASPIAILELDFLHEIGRVRPTSAEFVEALVKDFELQICDLPLRAVVEHAMGANWTRDAFDRLIVANAKAAGAQLLTADERIRQHYSRAIW